MAAQKTIHAQLLTPDGAKFDGDILGITVPGASGSFEMLYNHAPIVSALDVGKVEIRRQDGTELIYAVSGGFVEMNDNSVTLLAERATEPDKIDVPQAELDLIEAKARLKDPSIAHDEVERQIRVAKNLIAVAQN